MFTPSGDGIKGSYGGIKSNRSDTGNLNLLWFVAVAFGHRIWSLIKSDMLGRKCTRTQFSDPDFLKSVYCTKIIS